MKFISKWGGNCGQEMAMVAAIKQSETDSRTQKNTADQARAVLGDALTRREIVDALIDKVHVFPNNRIEISWKVTGFSVC